MNHTTRSRTPFVLSIAAAAIVSSAAGAGTITEPVAVTIENVTPPPIFYHSLMLFPVDQQGQPLDNVRFDTTVAAGVFSGDESSNVVRPIEFFEYIDDFGDPGDLILRIVFGDGALAWNPGEMLTFRFSLIYEPGTLWKIDAQFTPVPAPSAAAVACLAGLALLRRRR